MTDNADRGADSDQEADEPLLQALAGLPSDEAGTETFARYRWQTKQGVLHWLTCLGGETAPTAVVCEHVDDIVIVYTNRLRFAQLKTRDRGSWSASDVCSEGKGMDALIRSYKAARGAALHVSARFELWLEGPMAQTSDTAAFFADPTTATTALRNKLVKLGLPKNQMDDFLTKVAIFPNQPSRSSIDGEVVLGMGVLWPTLTVAEIRSLYARLLAVAEAAQSAERDVADMRAHLAEALQPASTAEAGKTGIAAIEEKTLRKEQLASLTPPLPNASREELLQRISAGEQTTALELKMRAAGVSEQNRDLALLLRAEAEFARQELLASRPGIEAELAELAERLLIVAEATVQRAALQSAVNPAIAGRPGEYVATELLSRPTELAAMDHERLFRQPQHLFGVLCQVSDQCRFWWRAS